VAAPCGGNGRCGKCLVLVHNPKKPCAQEERLLGGAQLAQGWRLACLTAVFDGMRVETREMPADMKIAVDGGLYQAQLDAPVKAQAFALAPPQLHDQRSDARRLLDALDGPHNIALPAQRKLPQVLRQAGYAGRAVVCADTVLDVIDGARRVLGVAVDIGTTTLAAYLLDLATGEQLAADAALNPQKVRGDDVISRCDHARQDGPDEMMKMVLDAVGAMVERMCRSAGVSSDEVYQMAVVGNTVMLHLFAGVSPEHIAQAPFIPAWADAWRIDAATLGLAINPAGEVLLLPCIAGYVGADTVAAILSCGLHEKKEQALLIDIGTNGEIALCAHGKIYTCSTAAGPAFEGAHIRCGVGSVPGAINTVGMHEGKLRFTTIDNQPPCGICGSGLVDLAALLIEQGAVDETGMLDADGAAQALRPYFDDEGFWLDADARIGLVQRDIRELQLAKGAIAAGIQVLLHEAGVTLDELEHVYLAGGFGTYLDQRNAGIIGLIPRTLLGSTRAVGNAAGAGARAVLLSRAMEEAARQVAREACYVELSARSDFQDAFMDHMFFT
ncbi:MAG: ASKHA domain-containing protein, partial [Eubacteriales bacterium]|nr:ASKHA domain-containing protein [Eubacteriales bacterium]